MSTSSGRPRRMTTLLITKPPQVAATDMHSIGGPRLCSHCGECLGTVDSDSLKVRCRQRVSPSPAALGVRLPHPPDRVSPRIMPAWTVIAGRGHAHDVLARPSVVDRRGRTFGRPGCRSVCRQARRGCRNRRPVPEAAPSLHGSLAFRRSGGRFRAEILADHSGRGSGQPGQSTKRLLFSPSLPACHRTVRAGSTAATRSAPQPIRGVPLRRDSRSQGHSGVSLSWLRSENS